MDNLLPIEHRIKREIARLEKSASKEADYQELASVIAGAQVAGYISMSLASWYTEAALAAKRAE